MHCEARNKMDITPEKQVRYKEVNRSYTKQDLGLQGVNRPLQKAGKQDPSPALSRWQMLTGCLGTKDNATTTIAGLDCSVPGTPEQLSAGIWGLGW